MCLDGSLRGIGIYQLPFCHPEMKLARVGQRRSAHHGNRQHPYHSDLCLFSYIQCHTRNNAKFIDDMLVAIDKVQAPDVLLLLGDLNAHVGRCESGEDPWRWVRGRHGL